MADEASHPEIDANEAERTESAIIEPTPEGATPPGYDWPTHGGYLGCLLAVMLSCLLAPLGYLVVGFLGAFLSGPLGGIGVGLAIAATVVGYLALFAGLTRLGWRMGKRYLREYPQPQGQPWGAEAATAVALVDSDGDSSAE